MTTIAASTRFSPPRAPRRQPGGWRQSPHGSRARPGLRATSVTMAGTAGGRSSPARVLSSGHDRGQRRGGSGEGRHGATSAGHESMLNALIFQDGEIYAPEPHGRGSVVMVDGRIAAVGPVQVGAIER